MLQAANTDLFNPLILKAHNSKCQNFHFLYELSHKKINLKVIGGYLFFAPSGLMG